MAWPKDLFGDFGVKASPIIFLLLWANGFIFLKIGLEYTDPFTFLALRYVCVVAVLMPLLWWFKPAFPSTRQGWLALVGVGLFLQAGYFAFTYLSLYLGVSAGTVALITYQQPILVALIAPTLLGEKVTATRWIGLTLGVAGATIVVFANSLTEVTSLLGLSFALLALLSITCSTFIEKRFGSHLHPLSANFIQCFVALVITVPLAYALEPIDINWSWPLFGALMYLIFGATLLSITLLLAMIRRGEASRVSALFFLVPPTTALAAYFFLGETLSLLALPGILLAAVGIYIVSNKS